MARPSPRAGRRRERAKARADMPYRPCVGIMLINRDGLVWVGKRIPKWPGDISEDMWQMPQGGIDPGESETEAAMRELDEEIGTGNAEIVAATDDWLYYDLPDEALGIALKGKYRGQKQKWVAMRFLGDDGEIDISDRNGHSAEFSGWKWVRAKDLPDLSVDFKRPVYVEVVAAFKDLTAG